jgi:hypothetical protein
MIRGISQVRENRAWWHLAPITPDVEPRVRPFVLNRVPWL